MAPNFPSLALTLAVTPTLSENNVQLLNEPDNETDLGQGGERTQY